MSDELSGAGPLEQPVRLEPEPYAVEAGFSNGDGTYSVSIERLPLPSWKKPVAEHPQKLLYIAQA